MLKRYVLLEHRHTILLLPSITFVQCSSNAKPKGPKLIWSIIHLHTPCQHVECRSSDLLVAMGHTAKSKFKKSHG